MRLAVLKGTYRHKRYLWPRPGETRRTDARTFGRFDFEFQEVNAFHLNETHFGAIAPVDTFASTVEEIDVVTSFAKPPNGRDWSVDDIQVGKTKRHCNAIALTNDTKFALTEEFLAICCNGVISSVRGKSRGQHGMGNVSPPSQRATMRLSPS